MATRSPDRNGRYPAVNACIYCGTRVGELTDEHIVPYSLRGVEVLPKASCNQCQKITAAFERICARTMFNSLRIRENMPTRRKKQRPTLILTETDNGDIELPVNDAFAVRPLVALPQAGALQTPPIKKVGFEGACIEVQADPPRNSEAWKRHHVRQMNFDQVFHVESLARLYAKICHGFAVAWFGRDSFEHWLPPYILGTDPHLPYVVGGMPGGEAAFPRSYQLSWRLYDQLDNLIVVNLRLFSYLGGPWSHVVVGKATADLCERMAESISSQS